MKQAKYMTRAPEPAIGAFLLVGFLAMCCAIGTTLFIPAAGWAWRTDTLTSYSGTEILTTIWDNHVRKVPLLTTLLSIRDDVLFRLGSVVISGVLGGVVGFMTVYAMTPWVDTREHHDGSRLLVGKQAVRATASAMKNKKIAGEKPIDLTDGIPYPRLWRVLNLLVVGGIGSGKTRIILALIDQLLSEVQNKHQRDKALLLYDTTGEILAGLPLEEDQYAAIHPHRPGGFGWAMGRDLETIADMEEAADQGIASSDEGMWGKGASGISAGCMAAAKSERGTDWGAPEYYAMALLAPAEMKARFEKVYPPAARLIEFDEAGELSKTSTSTLLTFRACVLRYLRPLAEAWADMPPERLISFRDWVTQSAAHQRKTVVMQRSGRHPTMSSYWIGMAIDTIATNVGDDSLPVSQTRVRTLVLDELPTLGKLAKLPELLDTGRNKGLSTIAALQDLNQLEVYGKAAKSLKMRFRLKIFAAQTPGPELKEIAEKEIGMRRVIVRSYPKTITYGSQGRSEQIGEIERIESVPIVTEDHLGHRLGVRSGRVKAILTGLEQVVELEWPMRVWRKRR